MAEIEPTQGPEAIEDRASEEADTEGHSMTNLEFSRTVARENHRAAERGALQAARLQGRARSRSILDRIRGR